MDVARPTSVARNKKLKRIVILILILIAATGVTLGLSRMKPAAPSVDRATVWVDSVKRGEMLRQVRGIGTLVPEEVRWIPATSDGIIEERRARAGDTVKPDTIILVLSKPGVPQRENHAQLQFKGAEGDLANLPPKLPKELFKQPGQTPSNETEYNQTKPEYE